MKMITKNIIIYTLMTILLTLVATSTVYIEQSASAVYILNCDESGNCTDMFVPYTGATKDLNMNGFDITAGNISAYLDCSYIFGANSDLCTIEDTNESTRINNLITNLADNWTYSLQLKTWLDVNSTRIDGLDNDITDVNDSLSISQWDDAYDERGSVIDGYGLNWDGSELDVVPSELNLSDMNNDAGFITSSGDNNYVNSSEFKKVGSTVTLYLNRTDMSQLTATFEDATTGLTGVNGSIINGGLSYLNLSYLGNIYATLTDLGAVNLTVTSNTNDIADINATVAQNTADINNVNQTLTSDISDVNSTLTSDIQAVNTSIPIDTNDTVQLSRNWTYIQNLNTKVDGNNVSQNLRITQNENDITNVNVTVTTNYNNIADVNSTLQTQITQNENDIDAINATASDTNDTIQLARNWTYVQNLNTKVDSNNVSQNLRITQNENDIDAVNDSIPVDTNESTQVRWLETQLGGNWTYSVNTRTYLDNNATWIEYIATRLGLNSTRQDYIFTRLGLNSTYITTIDERESANNISNTALANSKVSKSGDIMTGNLSLSHNSLLNVNSIIFNTSGSSDDYIAGKLSPNLDEYTLNFYTGIHETILQLGQEQFVVTINKAGKDMLNGQAVYRTGQQGDMSTIDLAKADNKITADVLGLLTHDCDNSEICLVTINGLVRELDTTIYTPNATLYLSATEEGNLTPTPIDINSGNFNVQVAKVERYHAHVGEILVRLGIDPFDGVTLNSLGVLTNAYILNNLSVDGNVGIGTTSPNTKLQVDGEVNATDFIIPDMKLNNNYNSLNDAWNLFTSAGQIHGGEIFINGDTTFNVSGGNGTIRIADDDVSQLKFFEWNDNNSINVATDETNWVGVSYNGGNPRIITKTSNTWNYDTEFPLGSVINIKDTLFRLNYPWQTGDAMTNVLEWLEAYGVLIDSRVGGLVVSYTGTRNPTLTAGNLLIGGLEQPINDKDCSDGDDFFEFYRDDDTGWNLNSGKTQWNNTHYDDGSGTLQEMNNNYYANIWVWVWIDSDNNGYLMLVYPQNQYSNIAVAESESIPSFPRGWYESGILRARITFKKGVDVPEIIETIGGTSSSFTPINTHSDLANLDYANAGHTGFASSIALAGNVTILKSLIAGNVSAIHTNISSNTDLINANNVSQNLRITENENDIIAINATIEPDTNDTIQLARNWTYLENLNTKVDANNVSQNLRITQNENDITAINATIQADTNDTVQLSRNWTYIQGLKTEVDNVRINVTSNNLFITNVRTNVSSLQTYTDNLRTNISSNQLSISNLETFTGNLRTNISLNQNDIDANTLYSDNIRTNVTTNADDISTNSGLISDNKAEIDAIRANVTSNDNDIGVLQTFDTNLRANVTTNQNDITQLESDVNDMNGTLKADIDAVNATIPIDTNETVRVEQLISDVTNINSSVETNTNDISDINTTLQSQIDTNVNDISDINSSLQGQIETNTNDIADINTTLKSDIDDINGSIVPFIYAEYFDQYLNESEGVTFSSLQLTSALTVGNGGTGTQSLTDGAFLFGAGTGEIEESAQIPNGYIPIGIAEGTNPAIVGVFTAYNGVLKHEYGGLEADIHAYANGLYGMISGATEDIDTSAEVASVIDDETGTGNMVFSADASLTGDVNFENVTGSSINITRIYNGTDWISPSLIGHGSTDTNDTIQLSRNWTYLENLNTKVDANNVSQNLRITQNENDITAINASIPVDTNESTQVRWLETQLGGNWTYSLALKTEIDNVRVNVTSNNLFITNVRTNLSNEIALQAQNNITNKADIGINTGAISDLTTLESENNVTNKADIAQVASDLSDEVTLQSTNNATQEIHINKNAADITAINATIEPDTNDTIQLARNWTYLENLNTKVDGNNVSQNLRITQNENDIANINTTLKADIDAVNASDTDTTYTAGGTLLDLTGTTFSLNEGTLTDTKYCTYEAGTGIECNSEGGSGGDFSSNAAGWINTSTQTTTQGKVGIGTISPSYPLEINNSGYALVVDDSTSTVKVASSNSLMLQGSNIYVNTTRLTLNDNFDFGVYTVADAGASLFVQRDTGNVGIGTAAPSSNLHILKNAVTDDVGLTIEGISGAGGDHIQWFGSTGLQGVIDNAGRIGIGVTNPTYILEVDGDAYFGDDVSAASFTDRTERSDLTTEELKTGIKLIDDSNDICIDGSCQIDKSTYPEEWIKETTVCDEYEKIQEFDIVTNKVVETDGVCIKETTTLARDLTITVSDLIRIVKEQQYTIDYLYNEVELLKNPLISTK